jgi:hypothetical protein
MGKRLDALFLPKREKALFILLVLGAASTS